MKNKIRCVRLKLYHLISVFITGFDLISCFYHVLHLKDVEAEYYCAFQMSKLKKNLISKSIIHIKTRILFAFQRCQSLF